MDELISHLTGKVRCARLTLLGEDLPWIPER